MASPDVRMRTAFRQDQQGRIQSTREPDPSHGPLIAIVRGPKSTSWAVRDDVPEHLAQELAAFARQEPPTDNLHQPPLHAERYVALLRRRMADGQVPERKLHESDGPSFTFPDHIPDLGAVSMIEDERLLDHHFLGWFPGEIAGGRYPVMSVVVDGYPVSICCSARRSTEAAEAGLDTAEAYRGRGFGPRVAAAWARAIRAEGLTPLYSTLWMNTASLAVANKLELISFASHWKLNA